MKSMRYAFILLTLMASGLLFAPAQAAQPPHPPRLTCQIIKMPCSRGCKPGQPCWNIACKCDEMVRIMLCHWYSQMQTFLPPRLHCERLFQ